MIPVHVQDSKPNETHKFLDLAQVMFKLIFRRGKTYVDWLYTNFITCSVNRLCHRMVVCQKLNTYL